MKTCLNCNNHRVIDDADPDDWFCDDDVAVVCIKTNNTKQNKNSKYLSERSPYKAVGVAIRPHHIKKEINKIPKWCPLKTKED